MPSDKTGERRDIMVIIQILKLEKDKTTTVLVFFILNQREKCAGEVWAVELQIGFFRERTFDFSLKYRAIQPLEVFGARRKAFLHGKGNAWAPISWSFEKFHEIGDLSYLGFTLYLSVLSCFDWFEALNDRLIGSKTWNRNEKKIMEPNGMAVTVRVLCGLFGLVMVKCVL